MPTCSFCKMIFLKSNALITHLKYIHQCHENSTYNCAETNCNRAFCSLNSYRRHINRHPVSVSELSSDKTENTNYLNGGLPAISNNNCSHNNSYLNLTSKASDILSVSSDFTTLESHDFLEFKKKLFEQNIKFICKLYSENTFCRKDVQKIMDAVSGLLSEPMKIFKQSVKTIFKNNSLNDCEISKYFCEVDNIFKEFASERLRFSVLEKSDLFIKPISFVVGERLEIKNSVPCKKLYSSQFIPISKVLTKFFSIPDILFETIRYTEHIKNQKAIVNIIQTHFWRQKVSDFGEKCIVFPLFIYYDDFEIGNPLGSHAGIHKLGGIYCSVACLPPKYQSQLENIFLLTLFHSLDLKEFGSKAIFHKMVGELNNLRENGIKVNLPSGKINIYFNTVTFLGDNHRTYT